MVLNWRDKVRHFRCPARCHAEPPTGLAADFAQGVREGCSTATMLLLVAVTDRLGSSGIRSVSGQCWAMLSSAPARTGRGRDRGDLGANGAAGRLNGLEGWDSGTLGADDDGGRYQLHVPTSPTTRRIWMWMLDIPSVITEGRRYWENGLPQSDLVWKRGTSIHRRGAQVGHVSPEDFDMLGPLQTARSGGT